MSDRKQQLLRHYRHRKRWGILLAGLLLLTGGLWLGWLWMLLGLSAMVLIHEVWFADHLFYSPRQDYLYLFPDDTQGINVDLQADGRLLLNTPLPEGDTLILGVNVRASFLGHWQDPQIWIGDDCQEFEQGVAGRRWLNLSGQRAALLSGELRICGRHCQLESKAELRVFNHPDYAQQPLLILAPHADDAELAAFGLYRRAPEVTLVTLTQGEVEAENYKALGVSSSAAARLKGRLRSWDSLAIPLWGGVPQSRCFQLGYYCLQLGAMAASPQCSFGSLASGESDICGVRQHNAYPLPGDMNGRPCWNNLVADLRQLIELVRPLVVVSPHPELDPHPDHVATTQALQEALQQASWQPQTLLLYANHLTDNDRWPMGPADMGVALPPVVDQPLPADALWSPCLEAEVRLDKALSLAMQHDLQKPLRLKQYRRRLLQRLLLGRRWPRTGQSAFFRKGVRRHELFWVRPLGGLGNKGEQSAMSPAEG